MKNSRRYAIVLAVYPNIRGFAFVLFESPLSPIDWGVKDMRGRRKQSRCVASLVTILDRYQPDIMVLQDTSPTGTQRSQRVTNLNAAFAALAPSRAIPVYAYSRDVVHSEFEYLGASNKQTMAEVIAKLIFRSD